MIEAGLLLVLLLLGVLGPVILRLPARLNLPALGRHLDREAQERAEALLKELLTDDEYFRLGRRSYLEVPSPSRPGRTYRVPRRPGQIGVWERGVQVEALCVQPVEAIPDGDTVLLHKLMIEGDEEAYLRTANHFELGGLGVFRRGTRPLL